MRIAYLDCFAGISGDMFLAALIDAGVDPSVLQNAAAAMNLGVTLKIETVDRSGISSTKVHVLENGKLADAPHSHSHEHSHSHSHEHSHDHAAAAAPVDSFRDQRPAEEHTHQHQPKTQHLHKVGHSHSHDHSHDHDHPHTHDHDHDHGHTHDHVHGRSLTVIRQLIQDSSLAAPVKHTAIRAFELLGASEAKIHNVPVDRIHFHEVGAVDAIIDIVAAAAGIHALGADRWVASPINVGGGMVDCAHGRFPVPAPATADLLRGIPTYSANVQMELVTPTGAALLRALIEEKGLSFGQQPAMRVDKIGYGAGTRNPKDFPNVLRLSVGETGDSNSAKHPHHDDSQTVTVLETALDDLSPQVLAYVTETALERGALDVMLTPVIMKKGRPGTLLTILCNPADSGAMEQLLLRETSTLGVRIRQDRRVCLERAHTAVQTAYGEIRIKLGTHDGETLNANPEFEDCRAAARAHNVPVKQVQQAALAAWLNKKSATHTKANG
jgi:pyridinium-3,5-bisthiocarboxylic acid mononucleotide nickel chelatase